MTVINKSILDIKIDPGYRTDTYRIEKKDVITSVRMKVDVNGNSHSVSSNFVINLDLYDFRDFIELKDLDSESLIAICDKAIHEKYKQDYMYFENNLIRELNYISSLYEEIRNFTGVSNE
jgi:hypothetical protein